MPKGSIQDPLRSQKFQRDHFGAFLEALMYQKDQLRALLRNCNVPKGSFGSHFRSRNVLKGSIGHTDQSFSAAIFKPFLQNITIRIF